MPGCESIKARLGLDTKISSLTLTDFGANARVPSLALTDLGVDLVVNVEDSGTDVKSHMPKHRISDSSVDF